MHHLEQQILLEHDLEPVFAFFADARNLEQLTPPWLAFAILTPLPIGMREGTLIDYRIRIRGIPLRWRSRITEWDPPHAFTDEQVHGPYRVWRHRHCFERHGAGTRVSDQVSYQARGGSWLHRWWVRPELERIFAYRQARMEALFPPRQTTGRQRIAPAGL